LYGYLDGTIKIPPQIVDTLHPDTDAITQISNPMYSHWIGQDNFILSTLIFSMTEGVLAQVVSHITSHVVWQALEMHFSSQSRARIMQIHTQPANAKEGSQFANEYFLLIVTKSCLSCHHLYCTTY
jgi:hypothetical protein